MQLSRKGNPSTLLFPGDMEGPMAKKLAADPAIKAQLKSTHYKIAHHGASTLANREKWLDAIDPEEAHVSCAYYGSFGHPRCKVIKMLVPKLGITVTIDKKTHPFTCLTAKTYEKKPEDITRYHPNICHRLYSTSPKANTICEIILVFLPNYPAGTVYYCHEPTKKASVAVVDVCPKESDDDDDDIDVK